MRLQKRFLRTYKDKEYYKYMINLPPELIEKAELKEGDELIPEIKNGNITLVKNSENKNEKNNLKKNS